MHNVIVHPTQLDLEPISNFFGFTTTLVGFIIMLVAFSTILVGFSTLWLDLDIPSSPAPFPSRAHTPPPTLAPPCLPSPLLSPLPHSSPQSTIILKLHPGSIIMGPIHRAWAPLGTVSTFQHLWNSCLLTQLWWGESLVTCEVVFIGFSVWEMACSPR